MTKEERIQVYNKFMPRINGVSHYIGVGALDRIGFFEAPASTRRHGSYEGGLFDHSFAVAKYLVELTEKLGLKWHTERSPYVVGMFHDFCKCDFYTKKPDETGYDFKHELVIPGHGERSVIMLQKYLRLTDEELACIRWHMGAYETDTRLWNCYGLAVKLYPNVLFTHTADMFVSKVIGV
jgi:hypothetical protein